MNVVDKSGNIVSENKEEDEEEEDEAVYETSDGNIFSVHTHTVIASQCDGLSSLGNLPSVDYQFSADELHLREDSRKLSECFDPQDSSPVDIAADQENILAGKFESIPNKELNSTNSKSEKEKELGIYDVDSQIGMNNDSGRYDDIQQGRSDNSSKDDKKENVIKAEIIMDSDNECIETKIKGNLNVGSIKKFSGKAVSSQAVIQNTSWSITNSFSTLKKAVVMFASHILGIIFPSFSLSSEYNITGVHGSQTFIERLFGVFRSQQSSMVKMTKKPTCWVKLEKWLQQTSSTELHPAGSKCYARFYSHEELRETKTVYQSLGTFTQGDGTSHIVVDTLNLNHYSDYEDSEWNDEEDWQKMHITFDEEGNPINGSGTNEDDYEREKMIWKNITAHHRLVSYKMDKEMPPSDLPERVHKYWAQRHRLFLRYDEGIQLDEESWYSVTPEMIAAHHAYRCRGRVVVDAFCGSGGNAIQLASTCGEVIAIDVDPAKIRLARHNARVYGVEDRIRFVVGDFFKIAPSLKADAILLSPPWGGTEYLQDEMYDVKNLGGAMDCKKLMDTARSITKNIALYLPRSSDLFQVIEFAGLGGCVDLEYNYMGNKKKALTAYFGDLVHY